MKEIERLQQENPEYRTDSTDETSEVNSHVVGGLKATISSMLQLSVIWVPNSDF